MTEYDFFETPVNPYTLLKDGTELTLNVRSAETMELTALRGIVSRKRESLADDEVVKLNCYGRLGERMKEIWYMQILEYMDDTALATEHELAQSLDIEQSLKTPEQFKSRRRQDKEG